MGGDAGRAWTGAWCGAGDVAGTRGGRRAQRPPGIPIVNGPTANPTLPAHPASRIPHPAMDTLRQDLSFALRTLRRDAAFALVAVFTLAVGIGAATVMFGVLRAVLLRPLPVREQERVLVMWGANARLDRTRVPIGGEAYRRYARESRALAGAAAVEYHGATEWVVRQDAAVERLRGALVSGNYFRVLGTRAGLGRTLEAADDVRGASPVLVISDRLWRRRYGGDPGAVGRQVEIVLTGRRFTIVGVMPPGVEYPRGADIWVPFATYLPPAMDSLSDRFLNVYLVGRLSRGATEERARAELASLLRGERSPFPPDFRAGMTAVATTLPALVLGDARRALWALAAAVAVLLLVACANVAGLLLVRGLARRGELAVRAAIGASSARIVRQLVTESAVLALAGGAAGVLLAVWSVDVLRALAPAGLPRADELRIDLPVLGAALLATLGSALLFGALPALAAARSEPATALRGGARLAAGATARARHALVVAQIALSVLVLAAAGLLVRSVDKLQRAELGFSAERVTVASSPTRGPDSAPTRWRSSSPCSTTRFDAPERCRGSSRPRSPPCRRSRRPTRGWQWCRPNGRTPRGRKTRPPPRCSPSRPASSGRSARRWYAGATSASGTTRAADRW